MTNGMRTTQRAVGRFRGERLNDQGSRRLADSNCCLLPETRVHVHLPQGFAPFDHEAAGDGNAAKAAAQMRESRPANHVGRGRDRRSGRGE